MESASFTFTPGVPSAVLLPVNGSKVTYTSKLDISTSGAVGLSACYDKYGAIWKWSTFEKNSLSSSGGLSALRIAVLSANNSYSPLPANTIVAIPSSWATMQCTLSAGSNNTDSYGLFPKKWRPETALSASYFNVQSQSTSSTRVYWVLSSSNWLDPATRRPIITTNIRDVSAGFVFDLQLLDYGTSLYTANFYDNTLVTLNAKATATSMDPLGNVSATYINQTFELTAVAPPDARIYTPNRYVLTGTDVKFENLIARPELVTSLTANCDDGKVIVLAGNDKTKDFTVSYDVVGYKTITISVSLDNNVYGELSNVPIVSTFPNIVQVLSRYDDVSVENYRSTITPLQLPWSKQPSVGLNDWVTDDNINSAFRKFYENLEYLETLGSIYPGTYSDYYGYLGIGSTITGFTTAYSPWTWEDVDCLNTSLPYTVTWRDMLSATKQQDSGTWAQLNNATWFKQTCGSKQIDPSCTGKYCVGWNWRDQKAGNTLQPITWKDTLSSGNYPKHWYFEACDTGAGVLTVCDEGYWNVNIPKLDAYYLTYPQPSVQLRCMYNGIVSTDNVLFLAQKTQIKILNSNFTSSVTAIRNTSDDIVNFSNIKNICRDSSGKIYVLDSILSQVFVYEYEPGITNFKTAPVFTSWGGVGTASSVAKFSNPNDIHIDQIDNVWICDTGNSVVKQYSNTGTWLKTIRDDAFKMYPPLSLAVDSQQNVHVLTKDGIRVYSYSGEFLFVYSYKEHVIANEPVKINTSYNREVIYVAFKTQVIKFFRTGVFAGYIIQSKNYIDNITGLYHDEYRNLLITVNDRVYKYADIMLLKQLKGSLPTSYWKLNDLLIHKEEYVQNWVYTKSFQRLWDNIEIFRNTLQYSSGNCKSYTAPVHGKEKMIIGQNEIVTSSVVNRVLGYLWDNFYTLIKYFDPSCEN